MHTLAQPLVCVAGVLIGAALTLTGCMVSPAPDSSSTPDDSSGPPQQALAYEYTVAIKGQGYFYGQPSGVQFARPVRLLILPTVSNPTVNNGVNPVDVAIITSASPIVGNAGALYFGTNTSLSGLAGSNLSASAIDIAFVTTTASSIDIRVDGDVFGLPAARLNTFNIYNLTTGVTAQIHRVLAGRVAINFSNDSRSVNGSISLGGSSGFSGGAVSSEYRANFTGTLTRVFT